MNKWWFVLEIKGGGRRLLGGVPSGARFLKVKVSNSPGRGKDIAESFRLI